MKIDTFGTGQDIVILHSSPHDPGSFVPLAKRLASRARAHIVYLPGYGGAPNTPPVSDLLGVRDAIAHALIDRGITRPLIAGFSGGAYRALQLAASGAVGVRGFALFGGFACLTREHRVALHQFATALRSSNDVLAGFLALLIERSFGAAFRNTNPTEAEKAVRGALANPKEIIADDVDALADSPDIRAALALMSVPIVACVGAEDVSVPPAYSQEIVSLAKGARLELLDGKGHGYLEESFDKVVEVIESLIDR
jgi:3-oxoadipate enol-lactonase